MEKVHSFLGKSLEIQSMCFFSMNDAIELTWIVSFENKYFKILFHNVSSLKIESHSAPLQVYAFDIVDHFVDGWEQGCRYEIFDYENGTIHFFCENFSSELLAKE